MIDIHCHMLPAIDDGAASWDDSLAMAEMAVRDGIKTIITTPHQLGNFSGNRGDTIRDLTSEFQELLDQHEIPLTVLPGADVRIEPEMIAGIRAGDVLTLADRRRHVLLELPHEVYLPLDRLLDDLRAARLVGILSHPERNRGILTRPDVLGPLVDAGCLMQVTAGSIVGTFGPQIQQFAQRLVSDGLVHFLATDAHSPRSRRPLMRRALQQVAALVGREAAHELCCRNPSFVAAGRDVPPGRARWARRGLRRWFSWSKAG